MSTLLLLTYLSGAAHMNSDNIKSHYREVTLQATDDFTLKEDEQRGETCFVN